MKKFFNTALNILLVVTCVVTCLDLVQRYTSFNKAKAIRTAKGPRPGSKLNLPNEQWKSIRSVVLAVQPTCPFCTASAPFYARLLVAAHAANVPVIALGPATESAMRDYLRELHLQISDVHGAETLSQRGVHATPTLIMVDQNGRVEKTWIGKLSSDEEDDVLTYFGRNSGRINGRSSPLPRYPAVRLARGF